MLKQLNIRNFRLFEHLQMDGLRRVNLIAGKNNTGKTALLEALRIMKAGEDLSVINYILQQRGQHQINYWERYDPLFCRSALLKAGGNQLEISIDGFRLMRTPAGIRNTNYVFKAIKGSAQNEHQLIQNNPFQHPIIPRDVAVYIPFAVNDYFPLEQLWESIVLTPKEDEVMAILRESILPTLVRLDVKADRILVRISGEDNPVSLKSLGDGAQRMLLIAIALVSAKNNLLLIDEIEAGLHYSVLEKLWEIIFRFAERLNVQVFATTHSSDAIKGFTSLLEKQEYHDQGAFFRLQANRVTGDIEAIAYGPEELSLSLETNLEPR